MQGLCHHPYARSLALVKNNCQGSQDESPGGFPSAARVWGLVGPGAPRPDGMALAMGQTEEEVRAKLVD